MSNLNLRQLTLFAPTNEAFQKYTGNAHVQYHMCKYINDKEILSLQIIY